jgi:spermidine synthase
MGTRKTFRHRAFDIGLELRDDTFISPPSSSQRNWVLSRAIEELADDLDHLDKVSKRFTAGSQRPQITEKWAASKAVYDKTQLTIDGQQVMQDWEHPYMEAMARVVSQAHGAVLEIGFGMGISATYIQSNGVQSHTIIECNSDVIGGFYKWKAEYPGRDISVVSGRWQDVIEQLGQFDAIFFDTYPSNEEEFNKFVIADVTFAAHFFATAARHIKKGGLFTYYSNEIDSVSRRHQRCLLQHFDSVTFSVVRPLFPPKDCNYWWADSMVLISATK